MKLFLSYLRSKRGVIAAFLLFAAILVGSFLLYRLPPAAVLYPFALCLLIGVILLALDFSRTKKHAALLSRLRENTETVIESLPEAGSIEEAELQRIIFRLQEASAQAASEAALRYRDMEDYYTAWAHQIKTPIAAMKLSLQQEDTALSRRLGSEVLRIEQYVEMVLTYLRLESDSSDYVFRACCLDDVIRPVLRKFAPEFIGRKLHLRYEPIRKSVVTDEKWLSFVLEQVLSNALKYTKEGGIRMDLEAPMTLCVADTGIGIAQADLPRIFEKGFTGCNGRADRSASGIGLWLCRRICKNLGFSIEAQSEVGKGTVIRIDLSQERIRPE